MSAASFRSLARAAAASYPRRDPYARHFAYGKLTRDPVFAWLLRSRPIADGARVLDLGCGQGLVFALHRAAAIPLGRYTGLDISVRDIERARAARDVQSAAGAAEFLVGDIRSTPFPPCDVVVALDVLHYVDREAQGAILGRVAQALSPEGVLLLRVADASRSLRLRITEATDRLVTRLRGHRIPRLWSRPIVEWRAELEGRGFGVTAVPMSAGTPFANALLVAGYHSR